MGRPTSEEHNISSSFTFSETVYSRFSPGAIESQNSYDFSAGVYTESVYNRTSNKVRMLSPGQPWKPCSGYNRHSSIVDRPSGEFRTVWRDMGPPTPFPGAPAYVYKGPLYRPFPTITWDPSWESAGFPVDVPPNTRIRCGTELMLKVKDQSTSYGEQLATLKHDVTSFAKTAADLARSLLAMRRGNWRAAAQHLGLSKRKIADGKNASERWLEYQYGFMPLAMDAMDTFELIQKGLHQKVPLMSAVRSITDHGTEDTRNASGGFNDDGTFVDISWQTRCKMKVYYSMDPTWFSTLAELGLSNPAAIAWELVPYSFVIDWFFPVGNFLNALDARAGVKFIDGCESWTVKSTRKYRQSPSQGYYDVGVEDTRTMSNTCRGYRRKILSNFPLPGFYFKSPLSSSHVVSALALIRQLF